MKILGTRDRYLQRLLETRGDDFTVVEKEIKRVLFVARWKQWLKQYFPRLSLNVLVTRVLKSDKPISHVVEHFAEESVQATLPRIKGRQVTRVQICYNDGSPWPLREISYISHADDLHDIGGVYLEAVKSKQAGEEWYYTTEKQRTGYEPPE